MCKRDVVAVSECCSCCSFPVWDDRSPLKSQKKEKEGRHCAVFSATVLSKLSQDFERAQFHDLELSAKNADLELNHVENVDRNLASASKPERVFTSTEASPQDTPSGWGPSVQAARSNGSFHSGQDSVISSFST